MVLLLRNRPTRTLRRAFGGCTLAFGALLLLTAASQPPAPAPPPVGAYAATTVTRETLDAATFAVRERARVEGRSLRLLEVASAEKQVVAGLNFRMTLRVARGREAQAARVVVYRPLQGSLALTSWEWLPAKRP
jgi:hypothetical protein